MATQIPLVPNYAGDIALRSDAINFPKNAEDQYTYLALFSTDWNVTIQAMNTTIAETNAYATSASNSATASDVSAASSASSALISASNANFAGKWSTKTGAKTVPYSVNDDTGDGNNYQLLEDIADITLSQPSLNPEQWKVIVSTVLPKPDFSASFNDGINIDRGYGSLDANSNKVVDFSRASTTGNINKSGVSETLAIDEPAITKNGLSVYESFDNELLWSEDFSKATWNKSSLSVGTGPVQDLIESTGEAEHFIRQSVASISNTSVCFTCKVKLGNGSPRSVRIRIGDSNGLLGASYLNLSSGVIYSSSGGVKASVNTLDEGWFEFSLSLEISTGTGVLCGVYLVEEGSTATTYAGDGISSVFIEYSQLSTTDFCGPYLKTEGTTNTRAPDVASIQMMNNMPAQGEPFTIMCECAVPENTGIDTPVFWNNRSDIVLYRAANSRVAARLIDTTGASVYAQTSELFDTDRHVFGVKFTGAAWELFVDGVAVNSRAFTGTPRYDVNSNLYFGYDGTRDTNSNSEIKNFEIYHRALSAEEVAMLGEAE